MTRTCAVVALDVISLSEEWANRSSWRFRADAGGVRPLTSVRRPDPCAEPRGWYGAGSGFFIGDRARSSGRRGLASGPGRGARAGAEGLTSDRAGAGNWSRPGRPVASLGHGGPDEAMTDLLDNTFSVPSRLGVLASVDDGEFRLHLQPRDEVLHHGAVRESVVAFMIDVAAGVVLDDDPEAWMLTSDLSVRMRPLLAPPSLSTRTTILRRGRRSATATVDLVTDSGDPVATGAIGFARVARRPTDGPKPQASPDVCPACSTGRARCPAP